MITERPNASLPDLAVLLVMALQPAAAVVWLRAYTEIAIIMPRYHANNLHEVERENAKRMLATKFVCSTDTWIKL